MPKNADATKSRMKSKSTRKPLREVSNVQTATKSANVSKAISKEGGGQAGDDLLDRLLLVHSDLSSLIRQIDELVVQALQMTSNKGQREIKQFADILSDMQTSLKPWLPRFQEALLGQPMGPDNKLEQTMESSVVCVSKESTNAIVKSPQSKWESLVSPSPLVSWRAECNTEGGRQLFLLTPLPQKKGFVSKYQAPSFPAFEKMTSDEIANPVSLSDSVRNLDNHLFKCVAAKSTPNRTFKVSKAVDNHGAECASPEKLSNTNYSLFLMTPSLKMSPPKSCVLLEPISEFSRKKNRPVHKSTPFPRNGNECEDSKSSSGEPSDDLKLNYPELCGIKIQKFQKRMEADDSSPNWIVSPPKSCVILEPTDDKQLGKTTPFCNQQTNFPSMRRKECQDIIGALDLAEATPMTKAPISSFRMGKHPGENTLKKELWTKFEAASTHGICFDTSLLQSTTKKGLLDALDEVSDA